MPEVCIALAPRPWDFSRFIGRMITGDKPRSRALRFGLATGLPCTGFFATYLLFNLQSASYFTFFMGSVVIASLFGGLGPGLVDTFLSAILGFMVAPPAWTLRLSTTDDAWRIAFFTLLGCVVSVLAASSRAWSMVQSTP